METVTKIKKVKKPRKAIFVSPETYARFRERANKNNRKYGQYLEILLDSTTE